MFNIFKKKKIAKKVAHLRKELAEHLDNAAYHYCAGNCEGYNTSVKMAIKVNHQIRTLRVG